MTNRAASKKLRDAARRHVLGANSEVHVVDADVRASAQAKGVPITADDRVWASKWGGSILDPAVLPFVLVQDGLGEGHHEVQVAFETTMCTPQSDGSHRLEPHTVVARTSLRSLVATVKHLVDEAKGWPTSGAAVELPFSLDLYQQCADEIASGDFFALDGDTQEQVIEWDKAVKKAEWEAQSEHSLTPEQLGYEG